MIPYSFPLSESGLQLLKIISMNGLSLFSSPRSRRSADAVTFCPGSRVTVIAAKAGNMSFAAVLTGVDGKNAYDYFSGMNADVILNSVLELGECL